MESGTASPFTRQNHMDEDASSVITVDSFSGQDDGEACVIRDHLHNSRSALIPALSEKLSSAFIKVLLTVLIITAAEADQIKAKQRRHQKASCLLGIVARKTGTQLKVFVDVLRQHCPNGYKIFNSGGIVSGTNNPVLRLPSRVVPISQSGVVSKPSSGVVPKTPSDVHQFVEKTLRKAATNLHQWITNSDYGSFQFYNELKSTIRSGVDVSLVTFENGFTLIHEVIRLERLDLLQHFRHVGVWTNLYSLKLTREGTHQHGGLTPFEYAAALNNNKATHMLLKLDNEEFQMHQLENIVREGNVQRFVAERDRLGRNMMRTLPHRGSTLLMYACQSDVVEMVHEVIRTEQLLGYRRASADKAIAICVQLGRQQFIRIIMEYARCNLSALVMDGRTAVEFAANSGDVETYAELLRLGAQPSHAAITLAAAKNRMPLLTYILASNPSLADINFQEKRGKTAGHFAAEKGYVEALRLLLEKGLDLTLKDKREYTILHAAASGGFTKVVEVIIVACIHQDYLFTMLTARDRYLGSECCFCVKGNDSGNPAWHYVLVDRGLIHVFRRRTEEGGVDVTVFGDLLQSGWGDSPPAEVARKIADKFDTLAVEPGAPSDMQAIHIAIIKKNVEVALSLIKVMKDIDQPDRYGLRPIHLAAMRGHEFIPVIKVLLERGASLTIPDEKGRTPRDIADANEHSEAAELLTPVTLHHHPREISDRSTHGIRRALLSAYEDLSTERVDGMDDPRQYTKSVLRDVVAEINDYLFDCLGEGPITMESMEPML